jgi:predicted peptidase
MKKRNRIILSYVIMLLISLTTGSMISAQTQTKERARIVRKTQLQYLSWFPSDYKTHKDQKFPLLIFLHGSGERGIEIDKVKAWGPPSFVENRPDFPFIVISPQCPEGQWWNIEDLDLLLTRLLRKLRVDPDRVYLTGLSMGGFGTWQWATTYPSRFAAIAPVCGGGDIQLADEIKNIPVWAFHGQDDPVVPVKRATEMVDAVNESGGNAKLTIYPGVGHDSWRNAYADAELYTWFLSHKRKK